MSVWDTLALILSGTCYGEQAQYTYIDDEWAGHTQMRWWKYINDEQKEHNLMMSGCGTLMMIRCDVYCT